VTPTLPSVFLLALLTAVTVGGCGSDSPAPVSDGSPQQDPDAGRTTRIDAPELGEGLHLEIRTATVVLAAAPDAAPSVRCTIRLCREDGTDAGPALMTSSYGGWDAHPEGWSALFQHGVTGTLFFGDTGGRGWKVLVTPDLANARDVTWTVTGHPLDCIK